MAENVINNQRKKSQLFLNNLAPVNSSKIQLIEEKLICGQFPLTKTGYIKIFAILVSLTGLALFLGVDDLCENTPDWYQYLLPIGVGINIGLQLLLYLIFSFGITVNCPGRWVKIDIVLNFVSAVVAIISCVFTITECQNGGTIHLIPGSLGAVGGIISIIGCGAIFLMYRFVKEENETDESNINRQTNTRVSIHA